jgi:hypothetical protein
LFNAHFLINKFCLSGAVRTTWSSPQAVFFMIGAV